MKARYEFKIGTHRLHPKWFGAVSDTKEGVTIGLCPGEVVEYFDIDARRKSFDLIVDTKRPAGNDFHTLVWHATKDTSFHDYYEMAETVNNDGSTVSKQWRPTPWVTLVDDELIRTFKKKTVYVWMET